MYIASVIFTTGKGKKEQKKFNYWIVTLCIYYDSVKWNKI